MRNSWFIKYVSDRLDPTRTTKEEREEFLAVMRGDPSLVFRRKKEVTNVPIGSTVRINLHGGGRVRGVLARRLEHAVVVAEVIVLTRNVRSTEIVD